MLTASQLDQLPQTIIDLYAEFEQQVLNDIARRLAGMAFSEASQTAVWQMRRLAESGAVYEDALKELAKVTGKSADELDRLFLDAGMTSMKFDETIYAEAGLRPLPLNLSPAMANVLKVGIQKTGGTMANLTSTTALDAQQKFIHAADLAYMHVAHGTMSYQQAVTQAVKAVAAQGIETVDYATGHRDRLDVAMRRTVITGVNRTAGMLQEERMSELGVDLVAVSAHPGARNKGVGPKNHASWQGKIYSRSGKRSKYPDFVTVTGYGTGEGLGGYNCVVGDTLVFGPAIRAVYRREYSGEIIIINTASGKQLTITPHHPILTPQGWIAAGLLNEGDYVIYRAGFDGVTLSSPNIQQGIARIDDVFNSLAEGGNFRSLPSTACYFHGDISDGKVDAVFPESFLGDSDNSALPEHREKLPFCVAPEPADAFPSDSSPDKILFCSDHTLNRVMGGFGEGSAATDALFDQTNTHSLGAVIGNRDTHSREIGSNQSLGNSNLFGNLTFPEAGVIQAQKLFGSNVGLSPEIHFPIPGIADATVLDAILNGMNGASIFIGDSLIRFTGNEKVDSIVSIERKSTQGSFIHVYNLETEDGWYYANYIIIKNCRHSFYPFFEGLSENAYTKHELHGYGKKIDFDGQKVDLYALTQLQRELERGIRRYKREASALAAAGLDNSAELAKVRELQGRIRTIVTQTNLQRQPDRERV